MLTGVETRRRRSPALVGHGGSVCTVAIRCFLGLWFRPASYESCYLFSAAILLSILHAGLRFGIASTFPSRALADNPGEKPELRTLFNSGSADGDILCYGGSGTEQAIVFKRSTQEAPTSRVRKRMDARIDSHFPVKTDNALVDV